jgi:7-dehydrocholesterol reductase
MADDDDKKSWGSGGLFANRELGSLALIVLTQVFCVPFFLICKDFNGSFSAFGAAAMARGPSFMMEVWPTPFDPYVWKMLLSFMAFELFLMRAVPGKVFKATPTASGHIPVYNANGVQCYLITLAALFAIAHYGLWNPADVYDYMPKILSSLNVFALGFCTMLTLKGLTFPSTKESGTNGNLIVDFFWGTELYPRILGFDVKQFTNCRFGLMFWQVGIICYAFKQYQLLGGFISSSMMVSVVLQTVYLFKFYYWETGYFCSMDIQVPTLYPYTRYPYTRYPYTLYPYTSTHIITITLYPHTPTPLQPYTTTPTPTARPRGLLHLLGLPRLRALDVHRAHVLHDRATQVPTIPLYNITHNTIQPTIQ